MSRRRTVRSVKASCDRLWSQVVRERAGGRCERCGATSAESQLHAHHVYGRSNHRLRFEPRNGIAFCAACHRSSHNEPLTFSEWFNRHRMEDAAWLRMENRRGLADRRSLTDYLELEDELKNLLQPVA